MFQNTKRPMLQLSKNTSFDGRRKKLKIPDFLEWSEKLFLFHPLL